MNHNKKARVIAFYLPQFHPIPENDEWWGKGFTEWTNVGSAKPLFKGHYQPRVPADSGYYDLRLPEVREAQAEMAKNAGIESFMYWHYWFGNGKRLLERPFNEVLKSGKPNFPFCLGWANHTWSNNTWHPDKQLERKTLIEQTYPGVNDYENHFYTLLDAFHDGRYTKVDGKPIFLVFNPLDIPNVKQFIDLWNELALKNGLNGIYFVALCNRTKMHGEVLKCGYNAINSIGQWEADEKISGRYFKLFKYFFFSKYNYGGLFLDKLRYKDVIKYFFTENDKKPNVFPSILPQWDRTPRLGIRADLYVNSTPGLFRKHVNDAVKLIAEKDNEYKILFLKSWNEWAEGNYVEPDLCFGYGYLNALRDVIFET